jgi:hypothetical protein
MTSLQSTKGQARPDLEFGNAGKAVIKIPQRSSGRGVYLTIDQSGRLLFACYLLNDFLVGRLLDDGTADLTFGVGGQIEGTFAAEGSSSVSSILVDEKTGNILLIGLHHYPGQMYAPGFALLDPSGHYVESFGEGGRVVIPRPDQMPPLHAKSSQDPNSTSSSYSQAVMTPDGKILYILDGNVALLNPDGTPDRDFANGAGYFRVTHPKYHDVSANFLVQPTPDLILVSGWVGVDGEWVGMVARYFMSGKLDTRFGEGGFFLLNDVGKRTYIHQIIVTDQNKLLCVVSDYAAPQKGLLIGLNENGEIDPAFADGKPVISPPSGDERFVWTSGAVDNAKNIVLTGASWELLSEDSFIPIAQFKSNGQPDMSFADRTGWLRANGAKGESVVIDQKGRIVLISSTTRFYNRRWPMILRYLR